MENAKKFERKRINKWYHLLKNILDQKDISNQFQDNEEALFQARLKPCIDEILQEKEFNSEKIYESCSEIKCERLLDVLRELKIPIPDQG